MYLCILRPLRAIAWNLAHKRCLAPLCPCHQISNPYFWTPSFALRALHKALHRWLNFEVPIGRGIILDQALPLPLWYLCNTTPLLALAFRKTLQLQPLSSILSWISFVEYLCACCIAEIENVDCRLYSNSINHSTMVLYSIDWCDRSPIDVLLQFCFYIQQRLRDDHLSVKYIGEYFAHVLSGAKVFKSTDW